MMNTSIFVFFALYILFCVNRIADNYLEDGFTLSGIMPWVTLLAIALFVMIKIDMYSIAIASEIEIRAFLSGL